MEKESINTKVEDILNQFDIPIFFAEYLASRIIAKQTFDHIVDRIDKKAESANKHLQATYKNLERYKLKNPPISDKKLQNSLRSIKEYELSMQRKIFLREFLKSLNATQIKSLFNNK